MVSLLQDVSMSLSRRPTDAHFLDTHLVFTRPSDTRPVQ